MKKYTTPEQTAKLIELGFEMPKSAISISWDVPEDDGIMINANSIEFDYRYSIGELIEMLPENMDDSFGWSFDRSIIGSVVCYSRDNREAFADLYYSGRSVELIDNLFYMIVKLKEEGVI